MESERRRERERERESRERERERERENSNSKTLFYEDCSLGLVKNLRISLAKLLMSKYKITCIIYIHIGMNE